MDSRVTLKDVWLKFKIYDDKGSTLKETIVNTIMRRRTNRKTEFWALKGVNIDFRSGDRIGIIGNNGAGKSTTLKLITRIYEPTTGTVATQGKVVPLIELGAGFNPELSGYENIFLNGAVMGISKKEMEKKIEDIINFSELREFIYTPIKYYSTGMYLRLAFTIATEIAPEILIIDELFAGGDVNFVKKAEKRLNDLIDNSHIVIMVSHSMDLIKKNCNRVLLLEQGQVIADGEPEEIINFYLSRNS
ncbi:ABC transporter ATP-binding protein [Paenibacillus cymbidii]|uniref:ABC transporter ATP-binding protein n=1 Tax=Paenibacillus cymbidii TaxID=1639034 RepID=UPI001A9ABA0F|nr:ABC transporter ATP-binding protein [Paenibacillus cymbidii]